MNWGRNESARFVPADDVVAVPLWFPQQQRFAPVQDFSQETGAGGDAQRERCGDLVQTPPALPPVAQRQASSPSPVISAPPAVPASQLNAGKESAVGQVREAANQVHQAANMVQEAAHQIQEAALHTYEIEKLALQDRIASLEQACRHLNEELVRERRHSASETIAKQELAVNSANVFLTMSSLRRKELCQVIYGEQRDWDTPSVLENCSQPPAILFTHLPKTAGTTFAEFLRQNVGDERYADVSNRADCTAEDVHAAFVSHTGDIDVITGHAAFAYRLDKMLNRHCLKITMLREPIERVVSHYNFMKDFGYRVHPAGQRIIEENISLKQYVTDPFHNGADNIMVRMLMTEDPATIPLGGLMRRHLEQAKDNLVRHFDIIALSSNVGSVMGQLCMLYGWKRIENERLNVNPQKSDLAEIPATTLRAIRHANNLDCELYEFAVAAIEAIKVFPKPMRSVIHPWIQR